MALSALPAVGQDTNFGKLALGADRTSGVLTGSTGGSTSLPAIVSNSDLHSVKCLGFGDPKPDHLLILQQDFPNLSVRVNSGGSDTTLVIQGPNGVVRCGDDMGSNKDASITDTNWKAGKYKIWVGTSAPGIQRDYTLTVQP
ncbi:MAG: hypothetical protein HC866_20135 [Leptolyngbyaceae cyanobacterium RU_5_1]|nr:hypothetical protein [Leptolyngbyaceae cyanobacterium RU_5_1]